MGSPPTNVLKCDKLMRPDLDTYGDVEDTSRETDKEEVDTNHSEAMTWTTEITEYKGDSHVTPWCVSKLQDDLEKANDSIRVLTA